MNAKFCVGLVLAGVLTTISAFNATAAQPQEATLVAPAHTPGSPVKPSVSAKKAAEQKRAATVSKSASSHQITQKHLPSVSLDLSLPPEMVRQLRPLGTIDMPKHKPLLPNMFEEKTPEDSPFQLNGRLLSNEMGLQLRNEARRNEVEGAALDFEFKQ